MGQIVVGYDGSTCGDAALTVALELASPLGDRVAAVFGYAPPGIWGGEVADHEEAIEEHGQKVMVQAQSVATAHGAEIDAVLVPKRPTEALLEIAAERDARMIVVGSMGEAPLKGIILGSTPHKLLHVSERPVLVVPADR
jgi:nucleotide-binding universal stress UspA family protein